MSRPGLIALLVALLAASSVAQSPAPTTAPAGVGQMLLDAQKSVGPSGTVQALLVLVFPLVLVLVLVLRGVVNLVVHLVDRLSAGGREVALIREALQREVVVGVGV